MMHHKKDSSNFDEVKRLDAVHKKAILDTPPDKRFDEITKKALRRFKVPISTIAIIDEDREWFKSCQGLDVKEGPREIAFCEHALQANNIFIVEDTLLDERFKDHPYVIGKPHLRFYAGMALLDYETNLPIGVFCIKDKKPRRLKPDEINDFLDLAHQAEVLINEPLK